MKLFLLFLLVVSISIHYREPRANDARSSIPHNSFEEQECDAQDRLLIRLNAIRLSSGEWVVVKGNHDDGDSKVYKVYNPKGRPLDDCSAFVSKNFQMGEQAALARDFVEAYGWYSLAAQKGNTEAKYRVGVMFDKGIGVERQNSRVAANYFLEAAKQGHVGAMNNIGVLYEKGRGVPRSEKEAMRWYREAADTGNAFGQYNLATAYLNGIGVQKDQSRAMELYRLAAAQGLPEAQSKLKELENEPSNASDKKTIDTFKCVLHDGNDNTVYIVMDRPSQRKDVGKGTFIDSNNERFEIDYEPGKNGWQHDPMMFFIVDKEKRLASRANGVFQLDRASGEVTFTQGDRGINGTCIPGVGRCTNCKAEN